MPEVNKLKKKTVCPLPCNGSILIVALWILTLFVLLVLSLGFRMNLEAKLSLSERESFEADNLALSGINLAAYCIEMDDNPSVDSTQDTWYNQPSFLDDLEEFSDLSITIVDAESRININLANEKMLTELFTGIDKNSARLETPIEDLVSSILQWRGDGSISGETSLGFENKGSQFESLYELLLIRYISYNDFLTIKDFVTVFSFDDNFLKINPNTASSEVLSAVIMSVAGDERRKELLVEKILDFRSAEDNTEGGENYFTNNDLSPYRILEAVGMTSDIINVSIVLQVVRHFTVNSNYFHVRANVNMNDRENICVVDAVLGPESKNIGAKQEGHAISILDWHEE